MFSKSITRLFSQQPSSGPAHRLLLYHIFHKSKIQRSRYDEKACYREFMKRNVQSSTLSSKTVTANEKEEEDESRPVSLIAQRMLTSQQVGLKQNVNSKLDDMRVKLENFSRDASFVRQNESVDCPSSSIDNFSQKENRTSALEGQTEDEDFIESIIFQNDIRTQTKPSPLLGTEDKTVPVSHVPCSGCGALLHCQHRTIPGFLPSERYKLLLESELRSSICQRCYYIQHCDAFVEVTSNAHDYVQIISKIRPTKSVVVMVIDVMDIQGSIIPNLASYIGHKHPLVVVGNKVDLIPPDSPDYLVSLKEAIMKSCSDAGLKNIRKVMLISAKTGFGIERLISGLFSFNKKKLDVFIVGTANSGKSSLFNTLLASDYCRQKARDLIQRATVSVWPGTTLNLLKFPIMNATPRTLALRHKRLTQEKAMTKALEKQQKQQRKRIQEAWELKEDVSTTDIRTHKQVEKDESDSAWGQEVFAYKGRGDGTINPSPFTPDSFDPSHYTISNWVYDTPGVINPDQTFNLLEPEECNFLQHADPMSPRCVKIKPGMAVYMSGLARLDYIEGNEDMMIIVHSASNVPIRVVSIEEADQFYLQHAGSSELEVPCGDSDRLNQLPSLVGKEIVLEGNNDNMAEADIQLSSLGWVSIAPRSGCTVKICAYTPSRKGIHVRQPPLLPRFMQFKGKRIKGTPFFWPRPIGLSVFGKHVTTVDDSV